MLPARSVFSSVARSGGVRGYATAATAVSARPPVALFGVDGTYASALYTASARMATLESTDTALKSLKAILARDRKLETVLASPMLNADDKTLIVREITKKIEKDVAVKNLLEVLAENNRLNLVANVIGKFETLMSAYRGEVEVVITSASELDSKTRTKVQTAISKSQYMGAGKTLKVTNKIDPTILGGLVVELDGKTIDTSVSSKVAKLNKLLMDPL